MTLSDNERKALIDYRIKQAYESAQVAEFLYNNHNYATSINRIYYAVFYSLLALGIQFGFKTSKHPQLHGWFNKNFIATGIIEREFGRILRDIYQNRLSADYEVYVNFPKEDIELLLSERKAFIQRIDKFLKEVE
jgi:uncharacterized protein (UPF0332 family)